MAKKPIERINFKGDEAEELKRLQDSVIRAVNPLTTVPIIDGVLLGPIALTTTATPVNHMLSRQYLGFIPVRNSAAAIITDDATWNGQTYSIKLTASVATTVYLWVF